MLVDDLGAALGDSLETYSEVNKTDCIPIVKGDRLNLQDVRPLCEAVLLVLLEGVLDLDCGISCVSIGKGGGLGFWRGQGGGMCLRPIWRICKPFSSD